jgi:prophage antirepressor-like protein
MNIVNFNYDGKSVTTILDKEMNPWFVAAHVTKILGHSNTAQAIRDNCDPKGVSSADTLTAGGKQKLKIINEPNLYRLIFNSRKDDAKKFQNWIFDDVLPTIRKTGEYSILKDGRLLNHTQKGNQISNSKTVNSYNLKNGGIEEVKKYNRENCIVHSGKRPSELKEIAKQMGLKSSQRTSGKEVLRNIDPGKACAMSMADDLKRCGHNLDEFKEITLDAIKVFDKLIKLGIKPVELLDNGGK